MSTKIHFELHLISDAETGCGLGNEVVNDLLARDHEGRPVLRGTHLKGLLRAEIEAISAARGWSRAVCDVCFGRGGEGGDDGMIGFVRIADCRPVSEAGTHTIVRTRLTDLGVVHGSTLRTTEAVSAGTVFRGRVQLAEGAPLVVDLAVRLALMNLGAVGGGRTRGSGACRVDVAGENSEPGALLRTLDDVVRGGIPEPAPRPCARVKRASAESPATLLRLIFHAEDPVCCPEIPIGGTNVIRSGLGIPASAVLGAVISRLAQGDAALADETMGDPRTRAWPLLPVALPGDACAGLPVRVALSHRMSKLPDATDRHEFRDAAVEPYDWRTVASSSPLKGTDGVLLRAGDGSVVLWRGGDMPRVVSAHAVHHGGRNLFTVEAMAPMIFSGWISLPVRAADALRRGLEVSSGVAFGKSRTVRGGGRLEIADASWSDAVHGWHDRVFVLQSPAAIPDDWDLAADSAEAALDRLVRESGWGRVAPKDPGGSDLRVVSQASCAVRFGWNRHGVGPGVGDSRQLKARRVFLPGTVFVLEQPPSDLTGQMVRGLGVQKEGDADGRLQGLGAVLPHPGIASRRYAPTPRPVEISSDGAGLWAIEWWRASGKAGPSASQISALCERIRGADGAAALDYLKGQSARPDRTWDRWKSVSRLVESAIIADAARARQALRTWQDLTIIHRGDEER